MQKKSAVVVIMLFFLFACKKNNSNDCSQAVCPAVLIVRPSIKFNFSDKVTNQDLFFGISPQYQFNDLVVFKKKNITDTTHVPVYIDSLITPKSFAVFTFEDVNTFFIQIQNQKIDTIDIASKPVITKCCLSGYIFSSIKLNGKLICTDCASLTIIDIKK